MSASSLIFVAIFAVWAAYMLQHWVRRREDLATARSVDRFSEAMRMLERRTPVKADLSARGDEQARVSLRAKNSTKTADADAPVSAGATPVSRVGRLKASAVAGTGKIAGRTPKFSLTSPEAKLGVLLAALAFCLLTLVLAPFGVVPAWLPLVGLVAVGGTVVWLRRVAVANRAARASRPAASVKSAARPAVEAERVERQEKPAAVSREKATVKSAEPKRSPLVAERVETASQDVVFDQEPDLNATARAQAEVFDAGWAPVEVPRPTYTMKAKAERAEVAPAATTQRPLAARYENTPVAELPFDGMALDEDYDELPQVYRAG